MEKLDAAKVLHDVTNSLRRHKYDHAKLSVFIQALLDAVQSYKNGDKLKGDYIKIRTDLMDAYNREIKAFEKFNHHYDKFEPKLLKLIPKLSEPIPEGDLQGYSLPVLLRHTLSAFIDVLKSEKEALKKEGVWPEADIYKPLYVGSVIALADCLLDLQPNRSNAKVDSTFHDFIRYCLGLIDATKPNEENWSETNVSRTLSFLKDTDNLIDLKGIYERYECRDKFDRLIGRLELTDEMAGTEANWSINR
jgi:hypothetical protein